MPLIILKTAISLLLKRWESGDLVVSAPASHECPGFSL